MTSPAFPGNFGDATSPLQDKAAAAVRTGRNAVADGIDSVASRLSAGGEHVADGARAAAEKMGSSATWLRDTSGRDMINSFENMVKAHPGRTVVGAVVVGFLVGRMLRGD